MSLRTEILTELNTNGLRLSNVAADDALWYQLLVAGELQGNKDLVVITTGWLDPDPRSSRFIHRMAGPFVEDVDGWRQAAPDYANAQYRLQRITDGDPDAQADMAAYREALQASPRTIEQLKLDIAQAREAGEV
jgi:hypothetical protein